jgi:hypothetical protein
MISESRNSVYIKDISPIYAVSSASFGERPTLGFTVTYSDGNIENVLRSDDDVDSALGLLTKTRKKLLRSLRRKDSS